MTVGSLSREHLIAREATFDGHSTSVPDEQQSAADTSEGRPTWSSLPVAARLFRVAHVSWGVVSLLALGVIWRSAITGRRTGIVSLSAGWLAFEGVALVVGRGDCPMGGVQRTLGDPVPMFELVLPPRAAKAAIPVLAIITITGMAGLVARLFLARWIPARTT
jgi:hypothetical protein